LLANIRIIIQTAKPYSPKSAELLTKSAGFDDQIRRFWSKRKTARPKEHAAYHKDEYDPIP